MRLIDADELIVLAENTFSRPGGFINLIEETETAYDVDAVVEQMEEKTEFLKDCTKYGNESAEQQEKSYSTMMMYEVADLVDDLIDIVRNAGKDGAE